MSETAQDSPQQQAPGQHHQNAGPEHRAVDLVQLSIQQPLQVAQHGQDSHHRGPEGLSQPGPPGGELLVPEQVEPLAQAILHQAAFK